MKKIIVAVMLCMCAASSAQAWCGPCPPPPPPHHYGWHHGCGSWWGRGGCNFWPGFAGAAVGAIAGSVIANAYQPRQTVVVQQPTVVTQPVIVQQPAPVVVQAPVQTVTVPAVQRKVWVEGRYVEQVQSNGTVVRVWQSGHFEYQ